jgi:hypothetical protein
MSDLAVYISRDLAAGLLHIRLIIGSDHRQALFETVEQIRSGNRQRGDEPAVRTRPLSVA